MEQKFYTVVEAAKILRICRVTLMKHIADGTVQAVKLGNRYLIPVEAIESITQTAGVK